MDNLESPDCSCEIVKVEIVNAATLEDKVREKVVLAVAAGLITLFLEQGVTAIARKVVEIKNRKKAEEAKKPKD